jgi:hypothetical protein
MEEGTFWYVGEGYRVVERLLMSREKEKGVM